MNSKDISTWGNDELPQGWATCAVEDIVSSNGIFSDGDWVESKDQDPNGDVRLIQLADIGDGQYKNKSNRFLTYDKALELQCTFLQPGDLLIARMPEPLGRACIFPGDNKKAVTVVDVCIVRSAEEGFNHKWLMHSINSPLFRSSIASLQSGSTRKRISRKNFARISFPICPLNEQNRTVKKIEELFSNLDAGVKAIEKTQELLKQYRHSALNAAVTGELTRKWREENIQSLEPADKLLDRILIERREKWEEQELAKRKDKNKQPKNDDWKKKYKEPQPPDTTGLPELPEGWVWVTLEQISWDSGYGTSTKCSYDSQGPPVLRIPNIVNSRLELDDLKFAIDASKLKNIQPLKPSDMLVIRTNGSKKLIGKIALITQIFDDNHYFASYLIRFRIVEIQNLPSWVASIWDSKRIRQWLENTAGTSAGQYNISQTALHKLVLPLPPTEEQQLIIKEIARITSLIVSLESHITRLLKYSKNIRQSILKQAFSGKLVPQDPSDEPASELLRRIKEEKVAVKEQEKIRKTVSKNIKSSALSRESIKMVSVRTKKTRHESLIETLQDKDKMKPEELLIQAGFKNNTDEIEEFYLELKKAIDSGEILEVRPNNTDSFLRIASK